MKHVFIEAENREIALEDIREALEREGLHIVDRRAEPVFPAPVIVPLDELMQKMAMVPLSTVKGALELQGLYVIGPADLAVLKAMQDVPSWALENNDSDDYYCPQEMRPPIQAELIRRSMLRGNSTIQRSGQ